MSVISIVSFAHVYEISPSRAIGRAAEGRVYTVKETVRHFARNVSSEWEAARLIALSLLVLKGYTRCEKRMSDTMNPQLAQYSPDVQPLPAKIGPGTPFGPLTVSDDAGTSGASGVPSESFGDKPPSGTCGADGVYIRCNVEDAWATKRTKRWNYYTTMSCGWARWLHMQQTVSEGSSGRPLAIQINISLDPWLRNAGTRTAGIVDLE